MLAEDHAVSDRPEVLIEGGHLAEEEVLERRVDPRQDWTGRSVQLDFSPEMEVYMLF